MNEIPQLLDSLASLAQTDDKQASRILFLRLLALSRELQLAQFEHKKSVGEARAKTDTLLLSLDNLRYEIQHLNREIGACESYESNYQDLNLVEHSQHEEMLKVLQFELEERKRLDAELNTLKTIRDEKLARNKAKRDELEGFDKQIDALVTSTLPLQKEAGLTLSKDKVQMEKAAQLPKPLFTLFRTIHGYYSLLGGQISVSVHGSLSSTKDSMDEMDIDPVESTLSSQLYEKHPVYLTLTIREIKDFARLHVYYLPRLEIVGVKPEFVEHFDYFPSSFLTSALFPNDDGLDSPNPQNELLLNGFKFDVIQAQVFAYHWIQSLSGLYFPFEMENPSHLFLGKVVELLLARRKQLVEMNTLFAKMCMGRINVPHLEDLEVKVQPFRREQKTSIEEQLFYGQIDFKEIQFHIQVHVPASYPGTPTKILILKETKKGSSKSEVRLPEVAQQISRRVQDHSAVLENPLDLFAHQLSLLVRDLNQYRELKDGSTSLPTTSI